MQVTIGSAPLFVFRQPYAIYHGDCIEVLRSFPDASVDSIVTDPPYGLSEHKLEDVIACLTAWLSGEEYRKKGGGFMNRTWDSWVPGPEIWRECLRVLKPGGHMLVFAGTRSHDLMSLAIRLAGFELRDTIGHAHSEEEEVETGKPALAAWTYGTGFPKNLDVAAAIDEKALREWIEANRPKAMRHFERLLAAAAKADRWALKWIAIQEARYGRLPGRREVVAHVPQSGAKFKQTAETIDNGGFNDPERTSYAVTAPMTPEAQAWEGWGTALKPGWEPVVLARRPLVGTVAQNVLEHGTGGLNTAACKIGTEILAAQRAGQAKVGTFERKDMLTPARVGRWPANVVISHAPYCFRDEKGKIHCCPGCQVAEQERQRKGSSRYFYVAKPHKKERNAGLEHLAPKSAGECTDREEGSAGLNNPRAGAGRTSGNANFHPTVKPIALMGWFCRLVTPPGGTVLDPFMGSGSTGCGARNEGFNFVGIEREADYLPIAESRIAHYSTMKEAPINAQPEETQQPEEAERQAPEPRQEVGGETLREALGIRDDDSNALPF